MPSHLPALRAVARTQSGKVYVRTVSYCMAHNGIPVDTTDFLALADYTVGGGAGGPRHHLQKF